MAATATTWPHGLADQLDGPDLAHLDGLPADELLAWAIGRFGDRSPWSPAFRPRGWWCSTWSARSTPARRS